MPCLLAAAKVATQQCCALHRPALMKISVGSIHLHQQATVADVAFQNGCQKSHGGTRHLDKFVYYSRLYYSIV